MAGRIKKNSTDCKIRSSSLYSYLCASIYMSIGCFCVPLSLWQSIMTIMQQASKQNSEHSLFTHLFIFIRRRYDNSEKDFRLPTKTTETLTYIKHGSKGYFRDARIFYLLLSAIQCALQIERD